MIDPVQEAARHKWRRCGDVSPVPESPLLFQAREKQAAYMLDKASEEIQRKPIGF